MIVILCTAPDPDVGARLARGLVDEGLAACVNLVPGLRSFYRWQGEVHDDPEVQLLVKTTEARFEAVRAFLDAQHPFDVPEIIALPIVDGSEPYLAWMREQTGAE